VLSQLAVTESGVLGDDVHLAQGNLTISMIDYARILTMLGNGGVLHGVRILSQEAVNEMHITNIEGDGYEQGLGTRFSIGGFMTGEGFFWHTGSGYGLLAQYLYSAEMTENRGVVVVTTGAISPREPNGMVSICNELSRIAWEIWDIIDHVPDEDEDEAVGEDEVDGD
jgi:CubicO group peptidase (beta-lactamase class C family)